MILYDVGQCEGLGAILCNYVIITTSRYIIISKHNHELGSLQQENRQYNPFHGFIMRERSWVGGMRCVAWDLYIIYIGYILVNHAVRKPSPWALKDRSFTVTEPY